MLWIKRNLFFVISGAVGLLLTAYCLFLFISSLNASGGLSEEYKSTESNLEAIAAKNPYPSKENVDAAKADEIRVAAFLTGFRKSFAPFPAPPTVDEKGFKTYLAASFVRFRAEATNAGTQLPADFAFSFPGLMGRLTYPVSNLRPWMEQLQEVNAILNILFNAKVNYLSVLDRVPISPDDTGAGLRTSSTTNQWGIVTPYRMVFRGFSAEIASVMEGFAKSSNCFIIKAIEVQEDKTTPSTMPSMGQAQAPGSMQAQFSNPEMGRPRNGMRPLPGAGATAGAGAPVGSSSPITILSEAPLNVIMSIDVVKLNPSSP